MAKQLYGLIGFPVKHSLSAYMHNAAFKACGIEAEYNLFEVKPFELKKFLLEPQAEFTDTAGNKIKAGDITGFNITIPHKVFAKNILEDKFAPAQTAQQGLIALAGAVNTALRQGNKIHYRNTDAMGFTISLKEDLKFEPQGKNILVLGCGGAGRAVVAGLAQEEQKVKKIYVYENDEITAHVLQGHFERLKELIVIIGKDNLESAAQDSQLVVNATPLGMRANDPSPIEHEWLHKNLSVYDVIYHQETQLVKDARVLGLNVCGGLGMLLYQGVLAWEFWTGKKAPVVVMRQALNDALNKEVK